MPAYDPRGVKGLGVTYATSPMGADHTAGNTIRAEVDHTDPNPQVELSRKAQPMAMIADMMGLCLFVMPALGSHLDKLAQIYHFYTGIEMSAEDISRAAVQALNVEHEFNQQAGLTPAQDRLPEFMMDEPLPVSGSVFDVPISELKKATQEKE
jgi:aldehyde:ferredoxin oxidoreductase